jgi:hypothetical protein
MDARVKPGHDEKKKHGCLKIESETTTRDDARSACR